MSEITELMEELDLQGYLDHEAIDYREISGSSGAQFNLRTCPVCGQDKWKVYLNVSSGLGNCFSGSCEAKFNKWSFVKAHYGSTDTRITVRHVKDVMHQTGWRPKRTVEVATNEATLALPDCTPLPIQGQNLLYLEERGIDLTTAKFFHLAYCFLGKHRYKRFDGKDGSQEFGGRIIIPVFDLDGNLVTFQGRDITGKAEKKYLFPSGLPATGRYLYNGHNILRAKRAVMGEGVFDVMALKLAMDSDQELRDVATLGSFGKHLSNGDGDQISQLMILHRRGLEELTIMWDGEPAALTAAIEAGERLQRVGLKIKIGLLPKGKDPNEVPAYTSAKTFYQAVPLTSSSAVRLRMSNPYA